MSSSSASSGVEATIHVQPKRPDLHNNVHPSEFLEFVTLGPGDGRPTVKTEIANEKELAPHERPAYNATQSNDDLFHGLSAAIPGLRRLSADARNAAKKERKMTIFRGFKLYPKAIMWSLCLSLTIVMEGYDLTLINSFYAFPVFRQNYGDLVNPDPNATARYQISAAWQSGLTNAAVVAEIIGLMCNGFLTDKLGYHKTMIFSLVWMALMIFLAFFAVNLPMLLVAQVLCGLPWGVFQTLSTTYAAEVMPVVLRSYLTSNVNMCWLFGQLIGVGVIRGLAQNSSQWSYKIPFALQWAFAVPILIAVSFAPESPWWLIRHEKPELAKKALLRLTTKPPEDEDDDDAFDPDETIAMMTHTNEVEKYLNQGGMSYLDCFKGSDRRRTEIACMVWVTQALCGSAMTGYAAYFYEQAGFNTVNSFNLACGMYALAIVGGIICLFMMRRIGRRTLYLAGLSLSLLILIAIGIVGTLPTSAGQGWALGSMLIILTFVYDATVGPVCYVLVAEIPSTRLRVKTVVLARVAYNVVSVLTNVVTPRMLNPTAWNWKGKSAFFYCATTIICLAWCYFRLPEPMGLTYMELDILFEKRAKAKKFKEFQVNLSQTGYFSLTPGTRTNSVWQGYS